jgi:hypothetical protein
LYLRLRDANPASQRRLTSTQANQLCLLLLARAAEKGYKLLRDLTDSTDEKAHPFQISLIY